MKTVIITLLSAVSALAVPTVVTDTLYNPSGQPYQGTMQISSSNTFVASDGKVIKMGVIANIKLQKGQFTVSLEPTDTCSPNPCAFYTVTYQLTNGLPDPETWLVPTSASPVNWGTVVQSTNPVISLIQISLSQIINSGPVPAGDCIISNGVNSWVPSSQPCNGTVTHTGGALTLNQVILGAGGGDIKSLGSLGTATTVLHGNASGPPSFGAVSLTTDVSGTLPVGNGGTGTTTPFTPGSIVFAGGSGIYSQDNANLFYSSTNHSLGLGTTSPLAQAGSLLSTGVLAMQNGAVLDTDGANSDGMIRPYTASKGIGLANSSSVYGLFMPNSLNVLVGGTTDGNFKLDVQKSGSTGTARFQDQTAVTGVTRVEINQGAGQGTTPLMLLHNTSAQIIGAVAFDGGWNTYIAGVRKASITENFIQLSSDSTIFFYNGTNLDSPPTVDTNISRLGPGLLGIGTSNTGGDFAGSLKLTNLTIQGTCTINGVTSSTACGTGGGTGGTAIPPFTQTEVAQTSVSITAATHGQGTLAVAQCFDNSTPRVVVSCSYTRNTSGDLVFSFNPAFTGLIEIGSGGGVSLTPYSQTITAQTSVTITAATHGKGTTPTYTCLDNSTPKNYQACAASRNGSGDLVFSFNPAFTGTIEVRP